MWPQPLDIEIKRIVWDIRKLDRAVDNLAEYYVMEPTNVSDYENRRNAWIEKRNKRNQQSNKTAL